MSDHHAEEKHFFEKYWQIGVIAFAVLLVSIFASYAPTSTGVENGFASSDQHVTQSSPDGIKPY